MDAARAPSAGGGPGPASARLAGILDRRADWIEALIVLATIAMGFVVLGFLATYFRDYFHLALIFLLAWLLAALISPAADLLQRRLRRLPRPAAVLGVIVPVIVIGALICVRLVAALSDSFASLAAALPGLIASPPQFVTTCRPGSKRGGSPPTSTPHIGRSPERSLGLLGGGAGTLVGGAAGAFGVFADALTVVTLAVFMAIDRERILEFGIELMPAHRRADQLLFRRSIGAAFTGFIRSQIITGAAYGVWALAVSLVFGLPFAAATAFLAGLIMSIPIYGPYVSWLPPVVAALLVGASSTPLVAGAMLVGWFINMNLLAPLVRSDQLQVNPIVVTFAFLLGAQLAGPIGAIIAIPLAAVAQAFFVEYRDRRGQSGGSAALTDDATDRVPVAADSVPSEPG